MPKKDRMGRNVLTLQVPGLLALALLFVITTGTAGEYRPVDRSMLWKADEACAHLLTPDLAGRTLVDTAYGYDVLHMDLDLIVYPQSQTIAGEAGMTVCITGAGTEQLRIDLTDSLSVTGVDVNGAPAAWTHAGDVITVALTPGASPGDTIAVTVGYSGHPPEVGNKGIKFGSYGGSPHIYVLSTPYSTPSATVIPISSYWRPCKDVPDDKSTLYISLTVPDTLVACSNGLMTAPVDNGDGTRTFSWQHDYPVAPYLVTFGVSDYVTIEENYAGSGDSTLVQHFVFPNRYTQGLESFNITVPAIDYLASIYGEYPFLGEKFGHFTIDAGVAVEEQTLVAYPLTCVNGGHSCDWLLVHELAHQWFGDCVTCRDWKEVWLNEGFASYSEALWVQHNDGAAYYRIYMEGMDNGPYSGTVYDPPYVWSSIVYDKGAWILHMLRWVMDEAGFFQMLLDYRSAFEYGNATTPDLVSVAESVYGSDLDWFFDQWIYHEGRPDYEYWWEYSGTGPYMVNVYLRQVQSMDYPTYKMPVRIRVNTLGAAEGFTVWDSLRTQAFVLEVVEQPTGVVPDPKHKILGDFTEIAGSGIDDISLREPAFLSQNAPNPFASSTLIEFGLPREQRVALRVFDVEGRLVRTLERGLLPAGVYRIVWDGADDTGRPVASGVYFCQLVGPDGVHRRSMLLAR